MAGHHQLRGYDENNQAVRQAPDDGNYHYPDREQLSKIGGGRTGNFAVIPSANRDGTSKGFDHEEPSVVHVDPDMADGTVVDLANISERDMDGAINASTYPHQVYHHLGGASRPAAPHRPRPQPARDNPLMPGAYLVPRAAQSGVLAEDGHSDYQPMSRKQQVTQSAQEEPMPQPTIVPMQIPPHYAGVQQPQQQPQQQAPQPGWQPQQFGGYNPYPTPPPQPPPMDPNFQAMVVQMANTVQGLVGAVQSLQQGARQEQPMPVGRPTPPRVRGATVPLHPPGAGEQGVYPIGTGPKGRRAADEDEEEDDREAAEAAEEKPSLVRHARKKTPQRVKDYERSQGGDDVNAVITGFETLKLPFVTGPLPTKARKQVFFEFENLGKYMARFHDVVESDNCIALIYDTRYDEGTQYLPPDLGTAEIRLHYPSGKKTFVVSSMGLTYSNGVFDHIVLIKHGVEDLDFQE